VGNTLHLRASIACRMPDGALLRRPRACDSPYCSAAPAPPYLYSIPLAALHLYHPSAYLRADRFLFAWRKL